MTTDTAHPEKPSWPQDRKRPPRVLLLAHGHPLLGHELAAQTRGTLAKSAEVVFEDLQGDQPVPEDLRIDFAVVLGGDGSILRAAQVLAVRGIPVLGVNLGKLGFLADIPPEALAATFPDVCRGACRIVSHLMFDCEVHGKTQPNTTVLGLNEVAIHAGPPYTMIDIDLVIDGQAATTYSCDGIIVSTPVGSTAHGLSAGGPILRKDLQAFVISPISPHTLTVRPLVDSADRIIELRVRRPHAATAVVVDGKMIQILGESDRVVIHRAKPQFQLLEVAGRGYYRTLREKLGWAGQMHRRQLRDHKSKPG
jgi:NAD+ kinase